MRPQPGAAWAPRGDPKRHRANYKRPHGVRYYFAGYDVYADKLWMRQRRRKRWQEVLSFLRSVRRRYPHGCRIYLVLDNLSSHNRRDVVEWCNRNNITMVFTATYASWMNRIECHFAPLKCFVISNSDYPDHGAIAKAIQKYLRWRNRNARDKKLLKAQKSIRTL